MADKDDVLKTLGSCSIPQLKGDFLSLGMIENLSVCGGTVGFDLALAGPAQGLKDELETKARWAVMGLAGVERVEIRLTQKAMRDPRADMALPEGIKSVIAVASGKGGVGKSSVAANLAVALAAGGAKVGLMDADVYGPNVPQMFGVSDFRPVADADNKIEPPTAHGVKLFSMGFLMGADAAAIWRGPMLHGAVRQFIHDVKWGELDHLIVDLPPGTGDVQLSLSQTVPVTGAVIVTTPQSIALSDVRKAVAMFNKVDIPILGIVENMSEFVCPHCSKSSRIFSRGGAEFLSKMYGVPCLGTIPLDPAVCEAGETGTPIAKALPDHPASAAFREIARGTAERAAALGPAPV